MTSLADFDARTSWNKLAAPFEQSRTRDGGPDGLIEYPLQLEFMGDIRGKHILDIGCGSGEKCLDFVKRGAASVLGLDIADEFIEKWKHREKPANLEFVRADLNALSDVESLKDKKFDIVVSFMVLGYSHDLKKVFSDIGQLLQEGGIVVCQFSSPLRWIAMKAEKQDGPIGRLYRDDAIISYPSNWNTEVQIIQNTFTYARLITAGRDAGLGVIDASEPDFPLELRQTYPKLAEWWDAHGGIVLLKYKKIP